MRSKLFVPGSRPELFAKALASEADAISLDLEDSVAPSRKAEARALVRAFLEGPAVTSDKTVIVRVNPPATPHFEPDLLAITRGGVAMVNVPKVESAADIVAVAVALARAEAENGVTAPLGILATIETPRGLRCALEIAGAHPRLLGLQLGLGDLFGPLGISRRDPASLHAVLFAVRLAAGEAGVFAYDSAFAEIKDPAGYRAEAEMACRLGYLGKSCIHPAQIALANDVFRPSDEEIALAVRVVAASRQHDADGVGAFTVDGSMIDAPFLRRAEAIVAVGRKMGLVSDG